jgi:hypothetical protein
VFSLGGLGRRELAVLFEFHLGCMIATPARHSLGFERADRPHGKAFASA